MAICLALLGLLVVFAMIWGVISSFRRKTPFEPAHILPEYQEPGLRELIVDLCTRMGTRFPDYIVLHCEPVFFVRHGKLKVLDGRTSGRTVAIGLPLLHYLTVNELRAVLAHEFAHFTGRDTLYSVFVSPVYSGLAASIECLPDASDFDNWGEAIGALPVLIPRVLLRVYLDAFRLVDAAIARSRETRADVLAAGVCGRECFRSALVKVAEFAPVFTGVARAHIIELLKHGKAFTNVYAFFRELPDTEDLMKAGRKEAMDAKAESRDSHPALADRIANLPEAPEQTDQSQPGASLLANVEAYERRLTDRYTEFLAARLVWLPGI
jgi:Zn-dependent protease with chaperone function